MAVPDRAPAQHEVDELIRAIDAAGVSLTGLNLFAGDMPGGERGIVSRPGPAGRVRGKLGGDRRNRGADRMPQIQALYGQRIDGLEGQDAVAIANLALAARRFAPFGGVLLVEALARGLNGAYPIQTAAEALAVVRRARDAAGNEGIAVLYDTFHLASNGEDLVAAAAAVGPAIGHVQIADAPGRGEPGTGSIDFAATFRALAETGYQGYVALEYSPTTPETALYWLDAFPQLIIGEETVVRVRAARTESPAVPNVVLGLMRIAREADDEIRTLVGAGRTPVSTCSTTPTSTAARCTCASGGSPRRCG